MNIFISGPITGVPDYKRNFNQAENGLLVRGHTPLNPAKALTGLPNEKAMLVCLTMLDSADAVLFLPDWDFSAGAHIEHDYALYVGKPVYYDLEEVPNL